MSILWLALLGSVILAEEQYFPQSSAKTWDEARDHCQTCFKDLATITCKNIDLILPNLNSEYWIGLRRRFNDSKAWSRWSNGDHVTYQNWYPGHPIPKKGTCSSTPTSTTPMTDSTSTTPVTDSTSTTPVTDSTSTTPVIDSTSPSMTDSTSTTPVIDSTSTIPVTDSTSTIPVIDSTSATPVTDSTSPPVTTPTSTTPVTDSTSTIPVTDSTSTIPVIDSTSATPVTDSTSPPATTPTSTTPVTDSTSTTLVTDSTSTTLVTDSTSTTLVTESTSTTPVTNSTSPPVTTPTSTIPMSSTTSQISTTEDQCSLLTQMLDCLNMTYFINAILTMVSSTPHPLYHTLLPVSMPSSTQRICDDDDTKEYIEDACVALLSNGMWEERLCNLNLSYICYEERFMGEIHISNPTETGASLSWSLAPGNITHYRVEVTAKQTFKNILNETDLSAQLLELKTGTLYDVQVIPVKCGRDLNPQNISFYTTPSAVYNLSVMMVTNESVELKWNHSEGYDFYSVNVSEVDSASTLVTDLTSTTPLTGLTSTTPVTDSTSTTPLTDSTSITPVTISISITPVTNSTSITPVTVPNRTSPVTVFETHTAKEKTIVISGLTPAKMYNFTVTAIVNGTIESVPESVSTYTKPSPILNLTSEDDYDTIINASWTKPNENLSGYRACLNANNIFCNKCSDCNECSECVNCIITKAAWINFPGKTPDTKYFLCVAGLTNNNEVQGEMVQIDAYTRPSKVAHLTLSSTNHSITANWKLTEGYKKFNLSIKADGRNSTSIVTDQSSYTFNELQAAVNYTITIITLSKKYELESDPDERSAYTKPSPVLNLTSADEYDRVIYAAWTKPNETLSGYRVCINKNNIFCKNCSDCNKCSECVECTNTTPEWIKFTGKTPDTKYILCVAALTNNNETQGEMVQIDAYTRPSKVTDLSLTSTNQSITANWKLIESYKSFNVSIKADGRVGTSDVTNQTSYTFNKLQAAESYTVSVITLSEKYKLESDPAERSVYTTPFGVYNLSVMKVTNESVELSWDHSGRYDFYSVNVSDVSKICNTTERTIVIPGLTPGKMYYFTVTAIVNGTTESVSESVSTYTKPSPVLNLKSADEYETIINASWTKPNENLSGYRFCLNENNLFCNNCSECINCNNTNSTDEWINFTDKTPGTKYILCVAALTNNNKLQGEMVQIDAYTRPSKVANLSLTSTSQSINASWELNEGYKGFNVRIEADGWVRMFNVTDKLSHFFDKLQAAVNYTITVITLSEKPKLESDPVFKSLHTKPVSPVLANATVLDHTAIKVSWEVPEQLKGDSKITYNVTAHSDYWKKTDVKALTENMFIIFNHLNSGTNYTFSVSVVAGNEESAPVFAYGMTVPNKKKVTFAVMCTSENPFSCSKNTTLTEIKKELENQLGNNFKDVYWKLKKIDKK